MADLFSLQRFFCCPLCFPSCFPCYFCISAPQIELHGSQEVHLSQTTAIRLHLAGDTTPSGRPSSIRFPGGRANLSRVTFQPLVHPGMWFPHIQCVLQLHHSEQRMAEVMCATCSRVARVVREFHSNLPFKVGATIFVRGMWVEFGTQAINRIYWLMDDDNIEYRALFADTDYERLMQKLTHSQGVWRGQPSTSNFTTFHMHSLTPVAKVWYYFLCVKIKPSLHLSTIMKDRVILLYAMTTGL